MPTTRLIPRSEIPSNPRGARTGHLRKVLVQAQQAVSEAHARDLALELTLEPGEREETVKLWYRKAAENLGLRVRFRTIPNKTRQYKNRRGKMALEASSMAVIVDKPTPG